MIWHIIGAGAIGQLFATRLIDAGVTIRMLMRPSQPFHIEGYYQLQLHEGKDKRHYQLPCESIQSPAAISHLLVCTKAPDTNAALNSIQHRLSPSAIILLLQNGMGQHEKTLSAFPNAHIWAGVTTAGAWRATQHELICVAPGKTDMGRLDGQPSDLPDGWSNTLPTPFAVEEIRLSMWRKLAINCAINPLTAIHRCANGRLVEDPLLRQHMTDACNEIENVTEALNLQLFNAPLIDHAIDIAENTAANRSSMLTDIINGRTTEIDFITGYLCAKARQLGIDVPINEHLLKRVKHISSDNGHATLEAHKHSNT